MIPHDYKALETEVRAVVRVTRLRYDTEALNEKLLGFFGQVADALSLAASLQDEIERLKEYVQHKPGCPRYYYGANNLTAPQHKCSCGLAPETGAK